MARAGRAGAGDPGRDTDADWRRLAETEPYFAVLASPDFKRAAIQPASLNSFYASGRNDIQDIAQGLSALIEAPLKVGRALDFGSGVGRLAEAMTAYADEVTGYDVAPAMVDIASARPEGRGIRYVDALPDGPFDWINSYIVFQHIPVHRGLQLLDDLLHRLAPGGVVSLHFTLWREERLRRPSLRAAIHRLARRVMPQPLGEMSMYDYDFTAILQRLKGAGLSILTLKLTDHGGFHGAMILGRRNPAGMN